MPLRHYRRSRQIQTIQSLFSATLGSDANGYNGFTVCLVYSISALIPAPGIVTQIRATIGGGSAEGLTITNAYIGHQAPSGDVYNFAQAPTQLLWSSLAGVAIGTSAFAISDWCNFAYNQTSKLVIAIYINGGTGVDTIRYVNTTGVDFYQRGATNEAGTIVKTTGYSAFANSFCMTSKIEVMASAGNAAVLYPTILF